MLLAGVGEFNLEGLEKDGPLIYLISSFCASSCIPLSVRPHLYINTPTDDTSV